MDPIVALGAEHAAKMHMHETPELLVRRAAHRRLFRGFGRGTQHVAGELQHLAVQAQLVAEMVVDGRDVCARGPADVAHGDLLESTVGEQARRGPEEPFARFAIASTHKRLSPLVNDLARSSTTWPTCKTNQLYNVRRNS